MEELKNLKTEIDKHRKHPKINNSVIIITTIFLLIFLIGTYMYFSNNQNQIKLTITNGSEVIRRLEIRAENAEKAQIQDIDSIKYYKNDLSISNKRVLKLNEELILKDKKIKILNAKIDSLNSIIVYKHSDLKPVK